MRGSFAFLLLMVIVAAPATHASQPTPPVKAFLESSNPPRVGEPVTITARIESAMDLGWTKANLTGTLWGSGPVLIEPGPTQRFEMRQERPALMSWTVTPQTSGFWGVHLSTNYTSTGLWFFSTHERGALAEDAVKEVDVDLTLKTAHVGGRNFTADVQFEAHNDWFLYANPVLTYGIWPDIEQLAITSTQPLHLELTHEVSESDPATIAQAYVTVSFPHLYEHEAHVNVACMSGTLYMEGEKPGRTIPRPCDSWWAPRYPGELAEARPREHGAAIPLGVLAGLTALALATVAMRRRSLRP